VLVIGVHDADTTLQACKDQSHGKGSHDEHPFINEVYRPEVTPLVAALNGAGIDERDVLAIVNTHLHFDHCGQNSQLPAPIWVQAAEVAAAQAPMFTVPACSPTPPTLHLVGTI
jgi:glyoxylase-like metal-dependent hydrolase (beta-lactamase superfamily II)